MASNRINLTISRASGRTSKLSMRAPTAAMMEMAEALADFMTSGTPPPTPRNAKAVREFRKLLGSVK